MLALLAIVILLLFFMSVGAPPLAGAILIGVLFVGFWVMVLKLLIGMGRWLIGEPRAPPRLVRTPAPPAQPPLKAHSGMRACRDARCGRVNVPEARFCAQCGRPLGHAA